MSAWRWAVFGVAVGLSALLAGYLTGVFALRDDRLVVLTVACALLLLPFLGSATRYGLLVLGLFVFLALLRRLVPGPSNDPAAFLPTLVTLPLAVLALQQRLPRHIVLYLGSILFAFVIGLQQPLVASLGLVATVGPLLAGYWLNQRVVARGGAPGSVRAALALMLVVVSIYGFYQFNKLPSFDRAWLARTEFTSANLPGTSAFRPWSTLASPGTAASFAALALLVIISWRARGAWRVFQWSAVALGVSFLALTKVRVGWLVLAVGLVVLLLSGSLRWRSVLTFAAAGCALVLTVAGGPVLTGVSERTGTLTALSEDESTQTRLSTYAESKDALTSVPVGLGVLSSGSRAGSLGNSSDNGYVVSLREGGLLGLLGVLALLVGQARASGPVGRALVVGLAVLHAAIPSLVGLPVFLVFLFADRRAGQVPMPTVDPPGRQGSRLTGAGTS